MNGAQTKKFLDALEAAEMTKYEFDSDLGTHIYNDGENAFVKFVEADEMLYGIRSSHVSGSHNVYNTEDFPIEVYCMWCEDAHECRTAGNYKQISTFLNNLGVDLTDDDTKILLKIAGMNSDIIPANGDYNRFVPLTEEQYNRLSPEEKEAYDAAKAADEEAKKNYIGRNMAAGIHLSRDW